MYPYDQNQSPYGQQWGGSPTPYSPVRPTNAMAVGALISAMLIPPLGIVFGHIARHQIRRTGEAGGGLALAGLIIGYLLTLAILVIIGMAVFLVVYVGNEVSHVNQVMRTIH